MTTTSDILNDLATVPCRCQCGKEWESELPIVAIGLLPRFEGRVASTCDQCLEKPVATPPSAKSGASGKRAAEWESICPELFRLESEGGKTDRLRLAKAHGATPAGVPRSCRDILDLWQHPGAVILAGKPGTMKTRMAWRMVRKAWESGPVAAFTAWTFQSELKDAGGSYTESAFMRRLTEARLVFVDDIGKAEWTSNTHGAFFELLDARIRHGRCLLMTTNEDRQSWQSVREGHRGAAAQSTASGIMRRIDQFAATVVMKESKE